MLRRLRGLTGHSSPPAPKGGDKMTLDHFMHVHNTFVRHAASPNSNVDALVESLRSMSEYLVWGDQHNDELPSMAMQDGLTNISGVRAANTQTL